MITKYNKGGNIYNAEGCLITSATDEENLKYYAAVVKCGHVGKNKYFIPIMFPFKATEDTINDRIACMPRVKRDNKHFILWRGEVTKLQCLFIKILNDVDPYIKSDELDENYKSILERRVAEPVMQEKEQKFGKRHDDDHCNLPEIKAADEYDDEYVLQKFFAPRRQGNQYIWPTRLVNKDELLKEYMTQACLNYAIPKKHEALLSLYYQIYGSVAPLNMAYENGCLTYTKLNGKQETIQLSEKIVDKLENKETDDDVEETKSL